MIVDDGRSVVSARGPIRGCWDVGVGKAVRDEGEGVSLQSPKDCYELKAKYRNKKKQQGKALQIISVYRMRNTNRHRRIRA